ncbi:MAG TPA: hypothetical protein VGK48_06880 [Terriglobia bacterium]|jgi:hypothetical protein
MMRKIRPYIFVLVLLSLIGSWPHLFPAAARTLDAWWTPGNGAVLRSTVPYENPFGWLTILNSSGDVVTKNNAFFDPIGSNGRACVTCHQPADGMSISVDSIRQRWGRTSGSDPLFATVDGKNCPDLPDEYPQSHSLLLDRGLIRVPLPWPPKAADGTAIKPEFTIETVRDPTGCNTSPVYGLNSPAPTISVYRRPRPAANLKYVTADGFGVGRFIAKDGQPTERDPETGKLVQMNMMADAREPSLRSQARSAAAGHLQVKGALTDAQLDQIIAFESQVYAAESYDWTGGDLTEEGGPPALGPAALAQGKTGVLGNNTANFVFPMGDRWKRLPRTGDDEIDDQNAFRESVARGHDVFFYRTFWIKDVMHLNTVGLGNPVKRTCATCHGMHMTGMDTANGWMDIGTTNLPWAREAPASPWSSEKNELPLFKLTCNNAIAPHPFLGRVIYTQDPGRALISGKCNDIGAIVIQQLRGLAARSPYFANGSAANLREVVDFYDRRFNIQFTEQEKQDLVNFLSVL